MANNGIVTAHMLTQDLTAYLEANSYGVERQNLFQYVMPTSPVVCRAVCPDGGAKFAVEVVSRPHVSVICRDTHINSLMPVANSITALLDKPMTTMERCHGRFTCDNYAVPYREANNHWAVTLNFSFIGIVRVV